MSSHTSGPLAGAASASVISFLPKTFADGTGFRASAQAPGTPASGTKARLPAAREAAQAHGENRPECDVERRHADPERKAAAGHIDDGGEGRGRRDLDEEAP